MKKVFLIVLLAFFLRIVNVGNIPPSLSWDEVSIGYNAYSILKTGRDEHQKFLPLDAFAAFGDYKPPLAIYLTVPTIALFGLNEFSVRLPSIFAGVLAVLLTFFLVKELFKKSPFVFHFSLLSSFLLAISPWHIQLSRAGFEANIATTLIIFGVWLVLKARENRRLLFICWVPFIAVMYTFNSARYLVPFLGLALLVYAKNTFLLHRKQLITGVVVSFILLLPILPHLLSKEARLRFTEVNIFSDLSVIQTSNDRIAYDNNSFIGKIFHNRRIAFVRSYLNHFFDHFEPGFLFIHGDGNPKFSIQDVGELYLVELPFLILGIYWMFAKEKKNAWFLLFWLIAAIIPAATARETPHALRIEDSLPTWHLFIAFGMVSLVSIFRSNTKKILVAGIVILYVMNFSYYLSNYYSHYAKEYSGEWQYGYREAIRFIQPIKNQYNSIVMTENIGRPYAYVLFYEQYNPEQFWKTVDASFDAAGFYNVYGFDRYRFVKEGIGEAKSKTLYILGPKDVPAGVRILKTIPLLNGEPVLVIFDKP